MLWYRLRQLKSTNPVKRKRAIEALGRSRDARAVPRVKFELAAESEIASAATDALVRIGPPSVDALSAILKNTASAKARRRAADALGRIGGPTAFASLSAALRDDKDADVRFEAVRAVGKAGGDEAIRPLLHALRDESRIHTAAYEALRASVKQAAVPILVEAFNDEQAVVRRAVVELLADVGGDMAATPLLEQLKVEDRRNLLRSGYDNRDVISAIVAALGRMRCNAAFEPLLAGLRHRESSVRYAAAVALGRLGDPRGGQELAMVLRDSNESVRQAAAKSLASIDWRPRDSAERAWWIVAQQHWDEAVSLGAPAVDALVDIVRKRMQGYGEAVVALGRIGNPGAVDTLIALLDDRSSPYRDRAIDAMAQIGDARAVAPIIAALRDNETTFEEINPHHSGDHTARVFFPLRERAALALSTIGDPRAVPPLLQLAREDRNSARRAIFALTRLMKEHGGKVSTEDLRIARELTDVFELAERDTGHRDPEGGESGTEVVAVPVDCTALKELARGELSRRGLQA